MPCRTSFPQKSLEKEISEICEKKTVKGETVTGYNVWSADTFSLFETVCSGNYLIRGFANQDIRSDLYKSNADTA